LQFFDEPWTPHDIRRTVATGMAEAGVLPHIVEACLNHISGARAGVAGVYNRAAYDADKRRALDLWADKLAAIIDDRASNILPMKRGA
jgi:integrase